MEPRCLSCHAQAPDKKNLMNVISQSFSWWCFADRGVADHELLTAASRIGYKAVELIDERLWPMARDAGLCISAIAGHDGIAKGMNRTEHADRIENALLGNIDKAVHHGIPLLICFSGNREGLDDAAGIQVCADILERITPVARQAGVTLIMELLNSRVNHQDYQCDHTAWGVELCRRVGSPNFKLLYDIYHMQIMEGDLIRTIQDYHPYFAHYHTAGVPGRGPMDGNQEIFYPAVYRTIRESGYEGYIGHEFIPVGDPVTNLEIAYQQCEEALRLEQH